ncbi:MAG: restriction endonuclease subunit S [Spirochaetia bacterium]|jgi:type I restriction enzyme S subunit|nr:restriction endonuclease subunit S [Spirochaetia bacterium]
MIPEGWDTQELANIAKISMGQSPKSVSYNDIGEGLYLIQGNADIKNRTSSPRIWTSEPTKTCDIDDILMTVRAPVGAIALSKHKACIGRGVCSIRGKKVDNSFLYQFLLDFESKWKNLEQGSTFTAVDSKTVKELDILLPPLPEQKKIASILSSVDEAIQATQKVIAQSELVKQGLLQELLTKGIGHTEFKMTEIGEIPVEWEKVNIEDIAIINPKRKNDISGTDTVSFIGMADVSESAKLIQSHVKLYNEVSKGFTCFEDDDVLVAKITPCFENGKGALITELENGIGFGSTEFHVIRASQKVLNSFIYYHTVSSEFRLTGVSNMTGSAGQRRVPIDFIKSFSIPLPPLPEQKKIASILSSVDDSIQQAKDKKEQLNSVKKGLMQDLLTGKVRVKV